MKIFNYSNEEITKAIKEKKLYYYYKNYGIHIATIKGYTIEFDYKGEAFKNITFKTVSEDISIKNDDFYYTVFYETEYECVTHFKNVYNDIVLNAESTKNDDIEEKLSTLEFNKGLYELKYPEIFV